MPALLDEPPPLRSFRPGGFHRPRRRGDGPLMRFGCPSEFFLRRRNEPSGSLVPTSAFTVFRLTRVVFRPPPSPALAVRVHPLLGLPPLQSLSTQPSRRAHAASTFLGVSSLHRDIGMGSPLGGRDPTLPSFRPRCFAHPRRFAPPHSLPACFIRLPRPRFPLQGFSPLASSPGSSPADALLSLPTRACDRVASPAPARIASPSGLSSDHRFRCPGSRLRLTVARVPS
jgi:hypothetical protein